MGPYCHFCDQRCFVHLTDDVPEHILRAYGTSTIIATCSGGQAFEKVKVGYCYADIKAIRIQRNNLVNFFQAFVLYAPQQTWNDLQSTPSYLEVEAAKFASEV